MKILDSTARRILDRLMLAIRPSATATRQGGHRSPVLASGVEFADHRAYVPGDDFRRIDWKAFARHGQLTLRQFEEERDARVYVMLDVSGSMSRGDPPKIEIAKRLAASFAYVGMRQFDRPVVLPFGTDVDLGDVRPLRGSGDLPELDRFLSECTADGPTQFPQAVRTLASRFKSRGLVVVISDLLTMEGFPEGFRTLGALGHQLRVVRVRCKEDERPDLDGEFELHDAETGETVRLRVSKDLIRAYQKEIADHVEKVSDAARRVGGRFVEVAVDAPVDTMLRAAFGGLDAKTKGAAAR